MKKKKIDNKKNNEELLERMRIMNGIYHGYFYLPDKMEIKIKKNKRPKSGFLS